MAVEVVEHEPIAAAGAHVVAAFPGLGLVGTIAGNYLVDGLQLREVGCIHGDAFPVGCVVEDGAPKDPVRIFAGDYQTQDGEDQPLVVLIGEFKPHANRMAELAGAILDWCVGKKADLIVSADGLLMKGQAAHDDVIEIYAVGSTDRARETLRLCDAPVFKDGILTGMTGVLLAAAARRGIDAIGILSEINQEAPDAKSAARVIELMAQIAQAKLDFKRLQGRADEFEREIRAVADEHKSRDTALARAEELMFT